MWSEGTQMCWSDRSPRSLAQKEKPKCGARLREGGTGIDRPKEEEDEHEEEEDEQEEEGEEGDHEGKGDIQESGGGVKDSVDKSEQQPQLK